DLASAAGRGAALRRHDGRLLDARRRPRRPRRRGSPAWREAGVIAFFERPLFFEKGGPRWYTIPAHRPFAQDLARGLHKALTPLGPDALSKAIVLTPTRRGARALADAFVSAAEGRAVLP